MCNKCMFHKRGKEIWQFRANSTYKVCIVFLNDYNRKRNAFRKITMVTASIKILYILWLLIISMTGDSGISLPIMYDCNVFYKLYSISVIREIPAGKLHRITYKKIQAVYLCNYMH